LAIRPDSVVEEVFFSNPPEGGQFLPPARWGW
jgi:hypothetical protein